jgi:hypothetical protein
MSVKVKYGVVGPGACLLCEGQIFNAGEHFNRTYDTPNGGQISAEGLEILSYSEPDGWAAIGKHITITVGRSKEIFIYEAVDGQLFENGVLIEPNECRECKKGDCSLHKTWKGWAVI